MDLRLHIRIIICLALFCFFSVPSAYASSDQQLEELNIEELMNVEVVTASRRAEPLSQVAGAVTVLTEEDIFRSGAMNIPEALKLIPGIHVAQVDTDKWAVGVRGFNGMLSNKHLVLIDGRPITSPTSAGVSWAGNDIPINMIKRIEVVRGAWTSLWSSDSFTGVINIITKTASETQGGQSVTQLGTTGIEQTVRFGASTGDNGHFRIYANGSHETDTMLSGNNGSTPSSDWNKVRGGFRADWTNAFTDELSIQGDLSTSTIIDGQLSTHLRPPSATEHHNGYTQFTWDRATGLDAGITLRTSYTWEKGTLGNLSRDTNTIDMELQYAAEQSGAHRLTMGIGGRYFWDDFETSSRINLGEDNTYKTTSSAFIQDKITLSPDSLYLILGSKLDYFGRGNLEIQPTARLLHTRENEEYWVAVSRAVRTSSQWQRNGEYSLDKRGTIYTVKAPASLSNEEMIVYEAGYRHIFSKDMRFDLSIYANDYKNLIAMEFDRATNTATLKNTLEGTAYGIEALIEWDANSWITLRPSATVIYQELEAPPIPQPDNSMPKNNLGSEFKFQIMTSPADNVGFDLFAAYLNSPTEEKMDGYVTLESHLSWQATESLMLELIGRNLGGSQKQFSRISIGPSVDLRVTWDF